MVLLSLALKSVELSTFWNANTPPKSRQTYPTIFVGIDLAREWGITSLPGSGLVTQVSRLCLFWRRRQQPLKQHSQVEPGNEQKSASLNLH